MHSDIIVDDFTSLPINKIIHGNCLEVLKKLPSDSIDCCITSPPYWSKREYPEETVIVWGGKNDCEHEFETEYGGLCKKCGAWRGQLGLEPDPFMYVDHLIEIFREVKRVLKPHGNLFVVIDDTYARGGGWNSGGGRVYKDGEWLREWVVEAKSVYPASRFRAAPRKSLCLVPEMFAIRMVYELGFVLRQKIIWAKKVLLYKEMETVGNAMPESVKSRCTHTHELVYHFAKEPDHYYNQLRLPYKQETVGRMERARRLVERTGMPITENNKYYKLIANGEVNSVGLAGILTGRFLQKSLDGNVSENCNNTDSYNPEAFGSPHARKSKNNDLNEYRPLGANAPDIIQINVEPNPEAHFATFPTKLVEFLISVGCPEQVCKKCGEPYQAVYDEVEVNVNWRYYGADESGEYHGQPIKDYKSAKAQNPSEVKRRILKSLSKGKIFAGYKPSCSCNAGSELGVVLDPFIGSGTTALVALKMGRSFIGIEACREYCEMAEKRIKPLLGQCRLTNY